MDACRRIVLLVAALAFAATLGVDQTEARGAQGLGERAAATSDACLALVDAWRDGAVPDEIEISGRMHPVVDLSRYGVVAGPDVREALQAAFDDAKALSAPILLLPPTEPDARYLRSGRLTLAVPG